MVRSPIDQAKESCRRGIEFVNSMQPPKTNTPPRKLFLVTPLSSSISYEMLFKWHHIYKWNLECRDHEEQ